MAGMTIALLLILTAFLLTILSAAGKAPLWAAVFVLVLERLITVLPL